LSSVSRKGKGGRVGGWRKTRKETGNAHQWKRRRSPHFGKECGRRE